jgi:hypothetical protein
MLLSCSSRVGLLYINGVFQAKNPEEKHKELKAQILYRLEEFEGSYDVYKDILKNSSDDDFEVRPINWQLMVSV